MDDGESPPGVLGSPASPGPADSPRLPHLLSELAGAFGDFGTIVPLVLAAAVICGLALAPILLFFGIWFIATGLIYRLPIPVEPCDEKVIPARSDRRFRESPGKP